MAVKTERITLEFDVATITARGAEIIKDIARRELAQQKALGNGVHVLTVDGRRRVTIERAKRRIQADFAAEQVEEAMRYVESAMDRRVPRFTGALRRSYAWRLDGAPVSGRLLEIGPGQVLSYTSELPYTRWAFWRARRKFQREFTRSVVRGAKRQFRALTITDFWVRGMPGLAIRLLKRFANG